MRYLSEAIKQLIKVPSTQMEGRQKAFKLCLSAFPRAKGNAFWFFPSRCLWVYVISEESALCTWTPCPASGGGWSVSEGCPRNMHAEEEPAWAWEVTAGKVKSWKPHSIQDASVQAAGPSNIPCSETSYQKQTATHNTNSAGRAPSSILKYKGKKQLGWCHSPYLSSSFRQQNQLVFAQRTSRESLNLDSLMDITYRQQQSHTGFCIQQ